MTLGILAIVAFIVLFFPFCFLADSNVEGVRVVRFTMGFSMAGLLALAYFQIL